MRELGKRFRFLSYSRTLAAASGKVSARVGRAPTGRTPFALVCGAAGIALHISHPTAHMNFLHIFAAVRSRSTPHRASHEMCAERVTLAPRGKQDSSMADQQALEQKYSSVGQVISNFARFGSKIDGIFMNGDKLVLKCEVPSKVIGNRVWDAAKAVDPNYPDFELQMTQTGPDAQPYEIQSGDNLSKVAEMFYGKASKYETIAKANNIDNPDHIKAGQQISVPPLD